MLMICEVCRRESDINLEEQTGQAACSECGGRFDIGEFVKKMLVETRSVIKERRRWGFMHACLNCSADREVKIKDGKGVCAICGTVLNIAPSVLRAISNNAGVSEDVEVAATERPMIKTGRSTPKKKESIKKSDNLKVKEPKKMIKKG